MMATTGNRPWPSRKYKGQISVDNQRASGALKLQCWWLTILGESWKDYYLWVSGSRLAPIGRLLFDHRPSKRRVGPFVTGHDAFWSLWRRIFVLQARLQVSKFRRTRDAETFPDELFSGLCPIRFHLHIVHMPSFHSSLHKLTPVFVQDARPFSGPFPSEKQVMSAFAHYNLRFETRWVCHLPYCYR
jgi:hypothetical protein